MRASPRQASDREIVAKCLLLNNIFYCWQFNNFGVILEVPQVCMRAAYFAAAMESTWMVMVLAFSSPTTFTFFPMKLSGVR